MRSKEMVRGPYDGIGRDPLAEEASLIETEH